MDRLTAISHGPQSDEPVCVDPERVHLFWPYVEGMIDKAMRRNDITDMPSVRADVLAGNALLWITWDGLAIKAAGVTKIVRPYDTKICILVACCGTGDWLIITDTIEEYARSQDCAITRIIGPKAWGRKLKNYKMTRAVMDREL